MFFPCAAGSLHSLLEASTFFYSLFLTLHFSSFLFHASLLFFPILFHASLLSSCPFFHFFFIYALFSMKAACHKRGGKIQILNDLRDTGTQQERQGCWCTAILNSGDSNPAWKENTTTDQHFSIFLSRSPCELSHLKDGPVSLPNSTSQSTITSQLPALTVTERIKSGFIGKFKVKTCGMGMCVWENETKETLTKLQSLIFNPQSREITKEHPKDRKEK